MLQEKAKVGNGLQALSFEQHQQPRNLKGQADPIHFRNKIGTKIGPAKPKLFFSLVYFIVLSYLC